MKHIISLLVFFFISSIYSQPKNDFILTPCVGNSILNSNTSEADIVKIVGKKNVEKVERWYAEGTERVIGSVFFKDTPQSFFIKWKDTVNFKNPDLIEIHGDKSLWEIDNGIKIGTELKELVKLNGKHFTIQALIGIMADSQFLKKGIWNLIVTRCSFIMIMKTYLKMNGTR